MSTEYYSNAETSNQADRQRQWAKIWHTLSVFVFFLAAFIFAMFLLGSIRGKNVSWWVIVSALGTISACAFWVWARRRDNEEDWAYLPHATEEARRRGE